MRQVLTYSPTFFRRRFAQNVMVLGSGAVIAQAGNVLATPLLAMFYEPQDFGLMAIFMGVVLFGGNLASLTYETAIVQPKEQAEAIALMRLSMVLTAASAMVSFVILSLIGLIPDQYYSLPHWSLVALVPLGIFALGLFNIANSWGLRQEAFREISLANVTRTIGAISLQLFAALSAATGLGLIVGRIGGQIAATVLLLSSTRVRWRSVLQGAPGQLQQAARSYYRFPAFSAPGRVAHLIADLLPTFMLGAFYGTAVAGLYWFTSRILHLPISILSEAVGKVFYAECTKKNHNNEPLVSMIVKTVSILSSMAIGPTVLLMIFAPQLFEIIFDSKWSEVGDYVQWMVIWAFCRFSGGPIQSLFVVLNEQQKMLKITLFAMVLRIPLMTMACMWASALTTVMFLSLFEGVMIIVAVIVIIRLAKRTRCSAFRAAA